MHDIKITNEIRLILRLPGGYMPDGKKYSNHILWRAYYIFNPVVNSLHSIYLSYHLNIPVMWELLYLSFG